MKKSALWLFLMCLLLTACELPNTLAGSHAPDVRSWFDAPLPGTVFFPPSPCRITAHGASPNGISEFELTINGESSALPSSDDQNSLVTMTRDCGITEPGEYFLRLRARDMQGNWSSFAETHIVIGASEEATDSDGVPTPTSTPTPATAAYVNIESISSQLVYYGGSNCDPRQVTISARAADPEGITVVVLFYRFRTSDSTSDFESIAMDPVGGDLYRKSLNPSSILGGAVPFDQAVLEYQVVVQRPDGDTSLRTPIMGDITVYACGSSGASPTPTLIIIILPPPIYTPTPPVVK